MRKTPLLLFVLLLPISAWAQAPAYRDSTAAGNSAGTSVTVTKPTGTASDDILIACLYLEPDLQTVTPPSGFTKITGPSGIQLDGGGPTNDYEVHVYWKRAGGAEPADYTWSWSISDWRSIWLAAYSGAITSGDPVDVSSFNDSSGTSTSMTATGVTTSVDDTMVIFCGTNFNSVSSTPPSGMTEREDFSNVTLADVTQASAGATGDKTATLASAQWNTGSLIVLKPPGAGGGPTLRRRRIIQSQ